jgi:hypothetical protein
MRRAVSTAYYAVFHALAKTAADCIAGTDRAARSQGAWRQVYRSLNHGPARTACERREVTQLFPAAIQDFANAFRVLQLARHSADYDPMIRLSKSEVLQHIQNAETAIARLGATPIRDRRAFSIWVLLPPPRP